MFSIVRFWRWYLGKLLINWICQIKKKDKTKTMSSLKWISEFPSRNTLPSLCNLLAFLLFMEDIITHSALYYGLLSVCVCVCVCMCTCVHTCVLVHNWLFGGVSFLQTRTMSNSQGIRQWFPIRTEVEKANENQIIYEFLLNYNLHLCPHGEDSETITKMRHYCQWKCILALKYFWVGKMLGTQILSIN